MFQSKGSDSHQNNKLQGYDRHYSCISSRDTGKT